MCIKYLRREPSYKYLASELLKIVSCEGLMNRYLELSKIQRGFLKYTQRVKSIFNKYQEKVLPSGQLRFKVNS